jgi:hypothetical protein
LSISFQGFLLDYITSFVPLLIIDKFFNDGVEFMIVSTNSCDQRL